MFRPMKPETAAKFHERRKAEQAARRADLIAHARAKAEADPNGIWPDLLAELTAKGED